MNAKCTTQQPNINQAQRRIIYVIMLIIVILMSGCSAKDEKVITKYQKVYIPIKCEVDIPQKPKFDELDPESAVMLGKYYIEVETLLKHCIGTNK